MIQITDVTLKMGTKTLFEDVNLKLTKGNCYGIIGANGAGKSTFLKLLSGEIEETKGEIVITKDERLGILKQDHFAFEEKTLIDTVIMGNKKLYDIMIKKEELYSKQEFTDEDGIMLGNLEADFSALGGWEAETNATILLSGLGIDISLHNELMKNVLESVKIKALLAQALFDNPDILLLDEPTNNLDSDAIKWLEEFLISFEGTLIVVSHDRHFLNKVCTHIIDIDYGKMKLYMGNYDFWYESKELALKQMKDANKKKEDKINELKEFIARFSANASKSKQATSRKKILDKIELEEITPSSRKYPYINFSTDNPAGKEVLNIKNLTKTIDGKKVLNNVSFRILKNDKIALIGTNSIAKTTLFKIIMGEEQQDSGEVILGKTIKPGYFPQDNSSYFNTNETIIEWLSKYYEKVDEPFVRSFLGRMLFQKEDVFKDIKVLSGGEKVRLMLSKMMLEKPNFLLFDEPTNHLDLESITSLNNCLISHIGEFIIATHDTQIVETACNRTIEIIDSGIIDKLI